MNWKEISTLEEWDEVFQQSKERGQVIFKHSTTCPISANALKEFDSYLDSAPNSNLDYTLVKVIESREVSNKIAKDVELKHESPQIIYLKDGVKAWDDSHRAITKEKMESILD
jgi:bacillithiol system protein YtxJ